MDGPLVPVAAVLLAVDPGTSGIDELARRLCRHPIQDGAHSGFHEAIGDTVTLSMTPGYLAEVGLINAAETSREADINRLMQMALRDLAVLSGARSGLLGTEDVDAVAQQLDGRLTKEQIEEVLTDAPQAPSMAQTTGIDPVFLVELAIKGMYTENLGTISQLVKALKLSSTIVNQLLQMATERKLVEAFPGERPLLIGADGSALVGPAVPADLVDSNGAGDAFTAALATALLERLPMAEALHRAASWAARVVASRELAPE